MILGTVVVADDRGGADGIADECRRKNHADIHHHAIRCHAVLTGKCKQLAVEQHTHHAHRHIAHKFGRAVGAGFQHRFAVEAGFAEPQNAAVGAEKVKQRNHTADHLAHRRGNGGARQLVFLRQQNHQHRIQNHIGYTGGHRHRQPQLRFFRRREKALEQQLQHIKRQRDQNDAAVHDAVFQQLALGTQRDGDGAQKHNAEHSKHHAQHKRHIHKQ